jgi:hypothetical protein
MIFESSHWQKICERVSNKCSLIFPHIKSKKLKSEIVSNLFETQSEQYFKGIQINAQSAKIDKDVDLVFPDLNIFCEIKVTGADNTTIKNCGWMGGKYSKRTSDYLFVIWYFKDSHDTLYGKEKQFMSFYIVKTYVSENEWSAFDKNRGTFYGTTIKSSEILFKEHQELVGRYDGNNFLLEKF